MHRYFSVLQSVMVGDSVQANCTEGVLIEIVDPAKK